MEPMMAGLSDESGMTSASAPIGSSLRASEEERLVSGADKLATTAAWAVIPLPGRAIHAGRANGPAATDRISDRAWREMASSHPAPTMTMKTIARAATPPVKALRTVRRTAHEALRGLDIRTRGADLDTDVIERATRQGTDPSTLADYG